MNKNKIKLLFISLFAFVMLFSFSACSCGNKYNDGKFCGDATVEGTPFYEMRTYYIEQYVFDKEKPSEGDLQAADGAKYGIYEKKYYLNEGTLVEDTDGSHFKDAHYLFTFYSEYNQAVLNVVNSQLQTNQDEYKTLLSSMSNLYVDKIANTGKDTDKCEDRNGKEILPVSNRLQSHSKACLVFEDNFVDPDTGVILNKITWKESWNYGFLNGLFVYPVAALINLFVQWFNPESGLGQMFAILTVTALIKIAIFLITFKSQTSTQKMQDMQPELLALQAKYGQTPTPEQRQKMSMEMMAIYQKYGVNPLAPFISIFITLPVFISVYRAVTFLGVLRIGKLGGIVMGNTISSYIIGNFRYEALIIFIVMALSQILTMKLPNLLNKDRMSKEAKQQQSQTNMMSNVMMIMILVMGFSMPVTMSVYWIASALVSAAQTIIMHSINNNGKNGRFKLKKKETKYSIPQGYKN